MHVSWCRPCRMANGRRHNRVALPQPQIWRMTMSETIGGIGCPRSRILGPRPVSAGGNARILGTGLRRSVPRLPRAQWRSLPNFAENNERFNGVVSFLWDTGKRCGGVDGDELIRGLCLDRSRGSRRVTDLVSEICLVLNSWCF